MTQLHLVSEQCNGIRIIGLEMSSSNLSNFLFLAVISLWLIRKSSNSKKVKRKFSEEEEDDSSLLELPIIELSVFLNRDKLKKADLIKECKKVSEALHEYSCIIVRDQRVSATDNEAFLNMMERLV